jgi:hypothetical protein
MRLTGIFTAVPFKMQDQSKPPAVRAIAIVLATACVAISLALLSRFAFFGFAIGGWTGLPNYREALAAARTEQTRIEFELLATQIVGGIAASVGFSPRQNAVQYLKKMPLFVLLFCVATALASILAISIAEILMWTRHRSPLQ